MTNEEKRDAAKRDFKRGLKLKELAAKYGVSYTTIQTWEKKYHWQEPDEIRPEHPHKMPREDRQALAAQAGKPTWYNHPPIDESKISEFDRRVIDGLRNLPKTLQYTFSVQDFLDAISEYLSYIASQDHRITGKMENEHYAEIPSVFGLCFWMGIPRATYYAYTKRPEYADILEFFRDYCQKFDIDGMQQGLLESIPTIFKSKVIHQMVEPTAPTHVTNIVAVTNDEIRDAISKATQNKQIAAPSDTSIPVDFRVIAEPMPVRDGTKVKKTR